MDRFAFYVQNPKNSSKIFNDSNIMQYVISWHNVCIGVKKQMASENGVPYAFKLTFI